MMLKYSGKFKKLSFRLFQLDSVYTKDPEIVGDDAESFWQSKPQEIYETKIQILDKISEKFFSKNIAIGEPIVCDDITIVLKRCFKNNPSENHEIYAFIEVYENNNNKNNKKKRKKISYDKFGNQINEKIKGKKIFAKYIFASSPGINHFEHPIYDIRLEF